MNHEMEIGSWTCPSGNSVDVTFAVDHAGLGRLYYWWDERPPLKPKDAAYYLAIIRPATAMKAAELMKQQNAHASATYY